MVICGALYQFAFCCLLTAFFFGDPHITTIDGLMYTFNGLGEYHAVYAPGIFSLQARTKRATNDKKEEIDATVFSAFAAKDIRNNSATVS